MLKKTDSMRSKKIFSTLALALILMAGCKKDDVPKNQTETVSVNPDGSLKLEDAGGAFYSIQIKNYLSNSGSAFDENQEAFAWVGNFPTLVDAGTIKLNDHELNNWGNYYVSSAVLEFGDTLFNAASGNATWNIAGNPDTGVPAFTHADNAPFPTAPSFTLPAQININNNLTITHTSTGGNVGVLYTLSGNNGDTTKHVLNTSSSMTFTSAEIKAVAEGNSEVAVSVMPVSYSSAIYGGKKYYFVKQHQYTRQTATL